MNQTTIRTIIVDDHPAVIAGVRYELERSGSISIGCSVKDSTELLAALDEVPCDVLVSDFRMPGGEFGDGLSLFTTIRHRYPDLNIVVMSALESPLIAKMLMDMKIGCIISKTDPVHHLTIAVHVAYAGGSYLSPRVKEVAALPVAGARGTRLGAPLSKRELEVIRLFVSGMAIADIAKLFSRSNKTVSTQKVAAMTKLNIKSDSELVRYVIEAGLVDSQTIADVQGNMGTESVSSKGGDVFSDSGSPSIVDVSG